jgi:hypothetical protein
LGNEKVTDNGRGQTYGFEFLYQERLTKNFYGILAYTYYYSLFSGNDRTRLIASAWDNRHLISFTGGYKLPRNWEIGVRFRYQGESPYTPYDENASLENYPVTNAAVLDYNNVNSLRLSAFNAADLRIDKKWNFKKWTLDLFLDIQNVYNSQNPTQPGWTLSRNPDNTIATNNGNPYDPSTSAGRLNAKSSLLPNTSGSRLPSIGFVVEF